NKVAGLAADVGYHRGYKFDKAARALPMGPAALGSHFCVALSSAGEGSIGEQLDGGQEKSEKNLGVKMGNLRLMNTGTTPKQPGSNTVGIRGNRGDDRADRSCEARPGGP
ncbi:unnamed protein product, partial [marine sediment metagenome]